MKFKMKEKNKVAFHTLGCKVNMYETNRHDSKI